LSAVFAFTVSPDTSSVCNQAFAHFNSRITVIAALYRPSLSRRLIDERSAVKTLLRP
jgi:hypothetical protein